MTTKAASKVVKQLAGSGTGQSLMDRVTQAKYSLAGSGLGKVVAKATTEEIGAPKKKHIDYLVNCSNEPNVSIPLLAGLLVERTQERSWVIVFKALITTHNLMNFGNEKFSHYLASNNCPMNLPNFNDKSSAQSYEMSLFIRRYSHYISEKISSYRAMAFDFCKVKRGRDDGVLRTMPVDKLLKALPVLSEQLGVLLEFEVLEKDLNNAIINAAFLLLYKDLIRLFASYNEGMMNLIEKYFSLKLKQCRTGLDLYHAFPDLQVKLLEFLSVAESLGIGDKDSLGLQPVPPRVIQAMEQHLAILESKKGSDDEDDQATEHPVRSTAPKKPTIAVPLPPTKPAAPQKPTVPPSPARTATASHVSSTKLPEPESEPEVKRPATPNETAQHETDEAEATPNCPAVIVNDEDGVPSELQAEIIAAATSHFSDTIIKSNEAVKRSVQQTTISTPVHTQLGRNKTEPRSVTVPPASPARSRSPSPIRPPRPHAEQLTPEQAASDGELEGTSSETGAELITSKRNLSLLGLNEKPKDGGASPICGSPFAADEQDSEPASGPPAWPEVPDQQEPSGFQAAFDSSTNVQHPTPAAPAPTPAPVSHGSALDDLLGLDLLGGEGEESVGITPTPVVIENKTTTAPVAESKPASYGLDDLLSLDPLLSGDGPENSTSSQPQPTVGATLLAGLKPVDSTVPIRPALSTTPQNKNPLDALDSTLVNLASSLGGPQGWGSTQQKKRPIT
uniref:Clathrin coat assembly protein n=1 Tax=Cryptocotyle lingua TaxID=66766 RepID=A0A7U0YEI4_9TREM|nr:clathrin coat assembly protein [Cryptocotyle lingua]